CSTSSTSRTEPRAPTDIRLLLRGSVRDVELVLHGAGGTVFEMRGAAFSLLPAVVFPDGFHPIGGEFLRENVVDGRLAGTLAVSGLEGELVLEAASFSRAAATVSASVDWTQPAPSFRNGLVEAPSVVTVPDGASRLSLLLEPDRAAGRDDEAWVAVFGPHDERLAVLRLRPGEVATLATPWAGDYVVAPLSGRVVVGADRLSSDFEPRPLALERTHAPAQPSRSGMDVRNETVEPRGVPFAVAFEPARATLFGCPDAFLRLDHAGDAIAVQDGRRAPDLLRASALLGDGGLTVASHAAPRGCTPAAFVITAYLRG
ncbi:MAG TPA: hypothetical protein VFH47_04555, partial [Candidatus Thermoplasmatota archaeon]|nr:hypothetical protein [Candidatus Thermoplasmatota archaeon]